MQHNISAHVTFHTWFMLSLLLSLSPLSWSMPNGKFHYVRWFLLDTCFLAYCKGVPYWCIHLCSLDVHSFCCSAYSFSRDKSPSHKNLSCNAVPAMPQIILSLIRFSDKFPKVHFLFSLFSLVTYWSIVFFCCLHIQKQKPQCLSLFSAYSTP